MPLKRGKSKAQNLGNFALKRKGDKVQQSDEDQPSKHSRNASPNQSSKDNSDNSPDADTDPSNRQDAQKLHGPHAASYGFCALCKAAPEILFGEGSIPYLRI
ncbi:hypothetical protein K438DRAFT_1829330 [Mycena galopus ATCC 62051]|nr:hypothetical protein K438DRAFT_1829330 [Mycena galopus ATCC 62051]